MWKLALPFICLAAPAFAQNMNDVARIDVIPGWETSRGTHMAGIRISLADGWKTYWRAPGDAGIPPLFEMSGINISGAQFHWPTPEVFDQNGMRSVGYDGELVLPVELTGQTNGPMHLTGTVQIGVCQEICVPVTLSFDSALLPSDARDASLLASVLDRPMTETEAGVTAATCTIEPISDGIRVTATVTVPHTGGAEEMVIEAGDKHIWVSDPVATRNGRQISGTSDMVHTSGTAFALDRSAVRITVLGRDTAVDIRGCTGG